MSKEKVWHTYTPGRSKVFRLWYYKDVETNKTNNDENKQATKRI